MVIYISHDSISYILPKCVKTSEPKDKHCVSWCIHISYHMHDTIPLDNPKAYINIVLPYITVLKIAMRNT